MGPIWGRQDPGGPHVGPMNFAIWVAQCHGLQYHSPALAITSHQQIMHVFADGGKYMNNIFSNYVYSVSDMHPGLHFQNV